MVQKPWFKVFLWFMATFFFFLASGVIISIFRPGPSESDVMKFMSGMMSAMDNSIMGTAMAVESSAELNKILVFSYYTFMPIIALSITAGIAIRLWVRRGKNVR